MTKSEELRGPSALGQTPLELPDVLDLLVVGGGPGGTAATLRAKELGLSVLAVDYDDILKRIRDYSKDKLILPNFGGGDRMRFPKGGELVDRLRFPAIDKDEMHRRWKGLYREYGIPVRVGFELVGIARQSDAITARLFDHGERRELEVRCRHLVLAIGRGVPRRFDVPGNTEGIAFRLDDPARYVGRPVCVIGGGTSAAEAVIAISSAKVAAEDPCAVYWSYRGDRLPRVSKALAEVFFEAYLGNGNIRYLPKSEPVAVVQGDDRRDYLALRTDRICVEGRPFETRQLEFPKEDTIACIGEDIPEAFLAAMGIHMVTGGPKQKKRMCVTPLLETQVSCVYLVGDILSQAYLEAEDLTGDPAGFREIQHRGNVKSALRDGVFVAEVVAQRLAGKTLVRVVLEDADDLEAAAGGYSPEDPIAALQATAGAAAALISSAIEPTAPATSPRSARAPRLLRVLPGGVEAEEVPLPAEGLFAIGRTEGDLRFADDPLLSERHATLVLTAEGCTLRDEGGSSGVFVRARAGVHVELPPAGLLRAGRNFLLLAAGAEGPVLRHFDHGGRELAQHAVGERPAIFGRDAPDVVLDAEDMSLSRRHFAAMTQGSKVLIKDLSSANGTYLKVTAPLELRDGDELRLGRQHFRYLSGESDQTPPAEVVVAAAPPSVPRASLPSPGPEVLTKRAPAPATNAGAAESSGAPSVTFQPDGRNFPVRAGQTLCEVAEENGVAFRAECHAGICGSDPIRILSGAEYLAPLDDGERETLEELCSLEPGPCRLACKARVTGPVVVEIIKQ